MVLNNSTINLTHYAMQITSVFPFLECMWLKKRAIAKPFPVAQGWNRDSNNNKKKHEKKETTGILQSTENGKVNMFSQNNFNAEKKIYDS